MSHKQPWSHIIRLADLPGRVPSGFDLAPGADACAAIAEELGLMALKKLRFSGTLNPMGKRDWRLEARLGATVTQPCVVTLEPVRTRIEETVERNYVAEMPELPAGSEVEMPEDETVEPLTASLDLGVLMVEALALALPLYPRADGAHLDKATFTEPGAEPMTDEAAKPFAGLKDLRDRLGKDDG